MSGITLPDPWRWIAIAFFVVMFVVTAILMVISYLKGPDNPPPNLTGGAGGPGGSPTVIGNQNIAIGGRGGPGGSVGGGTGGAGGGGTNTGNNMVVAGGDGGAAGDKCVWRHPAKSGYENAQKALGRPVDPDLRQYGRGGAVPGYEPKLQVIEQLRAQYFQAHKEAPQNIFQNINAVPTEYLNDALATMKETWRVRIVDEDEYEFFLPNCP
jgi:hypothetical protein